MRFDDLSFFSFRAAFADAGSIPPLRARARSGLRALLGASPLQLALVALTVLLTGIGIAIISSSDQQWWRLHFSRLGTFHDASGAFFNGTLIVGGTLVALFARAAGRDLRMLEGTAVRRGSGLVARVLFTGVGVNLALVGCVPLNVNRFVHDNVAAGMVVSFAGLLFSSPILLHRMPRRMLLATGGVFVYLFAGGWLFVTAQINLALFEVIAFSAMFSWSGVFVMCLIRAAAASSQDVAPAAAVVAAERPDTGAPVSVVAPLPERSAAAVAAAEVVEVSGRPAPAAHAACEARPQRRIPRAPRPVRARSLRRPAPHAARAAAPSCPRRGCTESAAPAASAR